MGCSVLRGCRGGDNALPVRCVVGVAVDTWSDVAFHNGPADGGLQTRLVSLENLTVPVLVEDAVVLGSGDDGCLGLPEPDAPQLGDGLGRRAGNQPHPGELLGHPYRGVVTGTLNNDHLGAPPVVLLRERAE